MKIGGYGQYDLYTNFNAREALSRIPEVSVKEDTAPDVKSDENGAAVPVVESIDNRPGKNGDVAEIALRLKTSDGFSSVDKAAGIAEYDVLKAYSDLEKDESLEQYQYFVGEGNIIEDSEDGVVIQKSGMDIF
jgi:hypothetical protein